MFPHFDTDCDRNMVFSDSQVKSANVNILLNICMVKKMLKHPSQMLLYSDYSTVFCYLLIDVFSQLIKGSWEHTISPHIGWNISKCLNHFVSKWMWIYLYSLFIYIWDIQELMVVFPDSISTLFLPQISGISSLLEVNALITTFCCFWSNNLEWFGHETMIFSLVYS